MLKQSPTPTKTEDIQYSLKKLAILSQLISYEITVELMDANFKAPTINQFARRIGQDCQTIKSHLKAFVCVNETDHAEEYVGALWRILDKLCELDLEVLQEHAVYLDKKVLIAE